MLRRKRWLFAILAILPTLALFAWLRMYPIFETLRLSLHKWDILSKNKPFIGLANFQELMGDRLFHEALLNTTIIAFGVLIITIPTAMILAAMIHYRTRSRLSAFTKRRSSCPMWFRSCPPPWPGNGSSTPGWGHSMPS